MDLTIIAIIVIVVVHLIMGENRLKLLHLLTKNKSACISIKEIVQKVKLAPLVMISSLKAQK